MTGPWAEIRETGTLGPLGAALIYETVDVVRRFDRYPPPKGTKYWDAVAKQEVAHDFIAADGAEGRLARLVASAIDEDSFERVVEAAVRNHFRMAARRTDKGAALRALTHIVSDDPDVVIAGSTTRTRTWSLLNHVEKPSYAGDVAPLIKAAHSVTGVRQARWSSSSPRRPPIADPESLRRVIHAVLEAAAGPVTPRLMLDVILARFPLAAGRPAVELDERIVPASRCTSTSRLLAQEVWSQLSDNERLVVGVIDQPVREVAAMTGLSRSTAHRACTAARVVLGEYLQDVESADLVVAVLMEASEIMREHGTLLTGSASRQFERD